MSEHAVQLRWQRQTPDFGHKTYNRNHTVTFKNGQPLEMSSTVQYQGDPDMVDPEEAFVAALSSCHMLTFLAIAAKQNFIIDSYEDDAVGYLERVDNNGPAITRIVLRPRITFSGDQPDPEEIRQMHDKASAACFIGNSIKSQVTVQQPASVPGPS